MLLHPLPLHPFIGKQKRKNQAHEKFRENDFTQFSVKPISPNFS
jgi:hypothetical protein